MPHLPDMSGTMALNVGVALGHYLGGFFLVVFGVGMWMVTLPLVFGVGLGFGFAMLVLTATFLLKTGAQFNTGVSIAKTLAWMTGLHHRDYYGHAHLWKDAFFFVVIVGMFMAGCVSGVALLKRVDNVGLLAALEPMKPNGNLAGDKNGAILLGWILSTAFVYVFLQATGPRVGPGLKFISAPIVIGIAQCGTVIVSVYLGAGTTTNFGVDLALATLTQGGAAGHLWISFLGQFLGALTAFAIYFFSAWTDRILEDKIKAGASDMDHEKINTLKEGVVVVFPSVGARELPLHADPDSGEGRLLELHTSMPPSSGLHERKPHSHGHTNL